MTFPNKLLIPNKCEYVVPALATASLIISCIIISSKKFFWNDELYSYYLLADPSFIHMMAAFHDKINNTPPLYFILGWLWARAFSSTELSLRLFSGLGICIACVVVWVTLRRTYNFWSASIGTLSVFCTSELILSQNAEARMYGLFMAICSLALLQFDINNSSSKSSGWIIYSNACIHAAMVNTHLFGLFYSGATVFAQIVRDRYFKIFRPKLYLSIVLSWLSLILYIPFFLNQADAGNPRTWIPIPLLKDLIDLLIFPPLSFLKLVVLPLLILVSGLQLLLDRTDETQSSQIAKQNHPNFDADKSLMIFAYAFLAVSVLIWIISRTVKPIFIDRYMIPTTLSWSILLAYLASRLIAVPIFNQEIFNKNRLSQLLLTSPKSILLLVIVTILILHPIRYAKSLPKEQFPGFNDINYEYKELPIVVQFSHDFFRRLYLEPKWENIYCPRWLEMRILSTRKYKLTVIGQVERRDLLLVENQ